jgi:hypothetical protein
MEVGGVSTIVSPPWDRNKFTAKTSIPLSGE